MKTKTNEEFLNEIYDLVQDEYSVLSKYINNKTKIKFRHNKCNNIFEIQPTHFLQGQRCPYCRKYNPIKTTSTIDKEIKELTNGEYILVGEYNNNKGFITLKHLKCNKEYKVKAHSFINNGDRCPYCSKTHKKTTEEFIKDVNKLYGDNEYTVLSPYINNATKIKVKHKCGYIYETTPRNFLQHFGCPKCANNIKKTLKDFKEEVNRLVNDEYTVIGNYINTDTNIKIKHEKCGFEYYVTPNNFLKGQRCPKCKRSKGEERIAKWLKDNNYNFETQYTFEDCKNERVLPFDFKLEKNNRIILIEYDGEFHYKQQFYSKDFELQKKRDSIKDNYCKQHEDIDLYRIPYTEFDNIESILEGILNNYK
jgi:hypothetical protein